MRSKRNSRTSLAENPEPPSSIAATPLLLDIKKASAFLGVSVWTLRELAWAKRVPSRKIGNGRTSKLYFTADALRQFVDDEFGLLQASAKRTGRAA